VQIEAVCADVRVVGPDESACRRAPYVRWWWPARRQSDSSGVVTTSRLSGFTSYT